MFNESMVVSIFTELIDLSKVKWIKLNSTFRFCIYPYAMSSVYIANRVMRWYSEGTRPSFQMNLSCPHYLLHDLWRLNPETSNQGIYNQHFMI